MAKPMSEHMEHVYLRAFALKDAGNSWAKVEELIALEGLTTDTGGRIKFGALSMQYSRARQRKSPLKTYFENRPGDEPQASREPSKVDKIDIPKEPAAPVKDDKVDTVDTPSVEPIHDKVDKIDKSEVETMLEAMEGRLMQAIEARITEVMAGTTPSDKVDKIDMPPAPPKDGRKFVGSKDDLRARVDTELYRLLETEAKAHHSGNMSRCLDVVLWRYFDRPRLSFEVDG